LQTVAPKDQQEWTPATAVAGKIVWQGDQIAASGLVRQITHYSVSDERPLKKDPFRATL